jgi:hypothetical protein
VGAQPVLGTRTARPWPPPIIRQRRPKGAEEFLGAAAAVVEHGLHLEEILDGPRYVETPIQAADNQRLCPNEHVPEPVSCAEFVVTAPTQDAILAQPWSKETVAGGPHQSVGSSVVQGVIVTTAAVAEIAIDSLAAAAAKRIVCASTDKYVVLASRPLSLSRSPSPKSSSWRFVPITSSMPTSFTFPCPVAELVARGCSRKLALEIVR